MISYIDHDAATIQHFAEDPVLADTYLQSVLTDGDDWEISRAQRLVNEARIRARHCAHSALVEA